MPAVKMQNQKAKAIMKDTFRKNWKLLLEVEKVDSRNWFEKLFDL